MNYFAQFWVDHFFLSDLHTDACRYELALPGPGFLRLIDLSALTRT